MVRFLILAFCLLSTTILAQPTKLLTPFERAENYSASYEEAIAYYQLLDQTYESGKLLEAGPTDAGLPLHTFVIDFSKKFTPEAARQAGKLVLLVNNGIHPGEPCGIDASMMVARKILSSPEYAQKLQDIILVFIPVYNVGGALNRGAFSRANQNGPQLHGFRGNAKNLDLNRDFIKCDSRNARTFNQLFQAWDPTLFVDNHTSNGADYQHTITLIPTQKDKLTGIQEELLQKLLVPDLYEGMADRNWEMCPYVYARSTPDEGIAGFLDLPRYSSGYAALHHTIGFMPETHMLKPFRDRVRSVEAFLYTLLDWAVDHKNLLLDTRRKARASAVEADSVALNWQIDLEQVDSVLFKGYAPAYQPSKITGQDRLYYDREQPYTKNIPFYNTYRVSQKVAKPAAYIVPQAYREVIDRLRWNGVGMEQLTTDTTLEVEQYYIESYESPKRPYENHYLHSQVEVRSVTRSWTFRKGDYWIATGSPSDAYVTHVLEPQAADSFFAWNFFDGILMQKEGYSSYVFEDLAWEFLQEHPTVTEALEKRKQEDPDFAQDARAQLYFIYTQSPYFEPTFNLYPVARVIK